MDTHAFLWFESGSKKLSRKVAKIIEDPENSIYISSASVWEIIIKQQLGKLPESMKFHPNLSRYIRDNGYLELPISLDHAEHAGKLHAHHYDPFDRVLIAQANLEDMILLTNDALFSKYDVKIQW